MNKLTAKMTPYRNREVEIVLSACNVIKLEKPLCGRMKNGVKHTIAVFGRYQAVVSTSFLVSKAGSVLAEENETGKKYPNNILEFLTLSTRLIWRYFILFF